MNVKCFMIEPTNQYQKEYRRYSSGSTCTIHGYHDNSQLVEIIVSEEYPTSSPIPVDTSKTNRCDCGYQFTSKDACQEFYENLYINKETGTTYKLRKLPIGAMYYAPWMDDVFPGPDGKSLFVQTPGGIWNIDAIASNCTKPNDRIHRCWVRHGTPPLITVDKNGNTCSAGAGSIGLRTYHGFLQNGYLTNCP